MAANIPRGGSCRICFYPQGGLDVTDLGTPKIGIYQELTFLSPEVVVDSTNNRIYADLTEADTIQLVEDVETQVQAVYLNDQDEIVYRFPVHNVTVTATVFDQFYIPPEYEYDEVDMTQQGYSEMNPHQEGWYEVYGDDYEISDDEFVILGKTYYTRSLPE